MNPVFTNLQKFRPNGPNAWTACCPAHKDKSPSLSIKVTEDGKTLLHCYAGCSAESIVSALGICMGDLFPDRGDYDPKEWKRIKHREIYTHEKLILRIYESDKAKGKIISSGDMKRVNQARSRISKLELMWGGAP
jgi:hypothetical protein